MSNIWKIDNQYFSGINMELRHLRYFVVTAEAQHFTRAAELLGMAQPPLSQQIRQLEQEVGIPLFGRTGRGVALNDAGRAFLVCAQDILQRAQAAVQESQAQQQPTIGVNASPTFGHVSGLQELQPGVNPPSRWSYSTGASVSYQLDLFGQIRRAIEAASGDAQAAQAAYDATRVTVAAETARAYANMCAAGMQLASAQHSVQVQKESLDAVSRVQRAGRGTTLDVTRARSQLEQLQANLPPFQSQQRTALYRLAALTGQTPNEIPASLLQCAAAPRLTDTIPVGDGAALLRRRPDIRQAERTLAASTARIGVATADLYPKITLGRSGA
ncbi:hypothetical protein G6F22_013237 [Rhizopus arrhizus]|nr:hypothetical protein G6F22_013237 [Rhizopus arrhizus]